MTRMAMPDGACEGVTIQGAQSGREKTYRGRIVDVDSPRDARTLREFGAFAVNLGGRVSRGYDCTCGFASYFRRCSRCGTLITERAA